MAKLMMLTGAAIAGGVWAHVIRRRAAASPFVRRFAGAATLGLATLLVDPVDVAVGAGDMAAGFRGFSMVDRIVRSPVGPVVGSSVAQIIGSPEEMSGPVGTYDVAVESDVELGSGDVVIESETHDVASAAVGSGDVSLVSGDVALGMADVAAGFRGISMVDRIVRSPVDPVVGSSVAPIIIGSPEEMLGPVGSDDLVVGTDDAELRTNDVELGGDDVELGDDDVAVGSDDVLVSPVGPVGSDVGPPAPVVEPPQGMGSVVESSLGESLVVGSPVVLVDPVGGSLVEVDPVVSPSGVGPTGESRRIVATGWMLEEEDMRRVETVCYLCGSKWHTGRDHRSCSFCRNCGRFGHLSRECGWYKAGSCRWRV